MLIEVKPTKSFQKEVLPSRILIENALYMWVTKYMGSLEFSKFASQKEEHWENLVQGQIHSKHNLNYV